MNDLKIVAYQEQYKLDFELLNRQWIEEYFEMEEEDLSILQNPHSYVLEKNGEIFFAIKGGKVVGTAAMVPTEIGIFELAKMAVEKNYQNHGIGKQLLKRCIKFAKEREAREIFLITNDILKPALNLYLSCGFETNEQNDDNRYLRGNTKMNLILGEK